MLTLHNSKPRIVTNDSLADDGRTVPAALHLPEGKYFFGFTYKPFDPSKVVKKEDVDAVGLTQALLDDTDDKEQQPTTTFSGQGNTLSNRKIRSGTDAAESSSSATSAVPVEKVDPWANLGSGATLSTRKVVEATPPRPAEIVDLSQDDDDDDDDFGYGEEPDDEDDVIVIDSD